MEDNNQQFLEISQLIELHSSKKSELETLREALIMERAQSDVQSKLEALTLQIEQEEMMIRNWLSQFNETVMRFNSLAQSYHELQDQDQNRNSDQQLAQYFMTLTVSSLKPSTVDQIKLFNDVLVKWHAFNQKIMGELKAKELEITKQLNELETTLSDLEKGIKPFPLNVIKLKQLLESKGIGQVTILSEVLEVTDLRWKNVIEGYLHTQKFYL